MLHINVILWSIAACALPSSSSALKVQLQIAQAQPSRIATKVVEEESIISPPQFHPHFDGHADGHSERVFRFRQASPHTTSNAILPKNALVNEQASHAKDPQWLHSQRDSTLGHFQKRSSGGHFFLKIAFFSIFVLMLGGAVSFVLHELHESEESETADNDHLQGSSTKAGDQYPQSERYRPPLSDGSANAPSRTHKQLAEAVEGTNGTWACTFRRAHSTQREALNLLFLCGIIPQKEFASSHVSQEHIDECVWIATHMLRQRPLEEWLATYTEAQQTFEASVTACFSARHDMLNSRSDLSLDQVVEEVISGSPRRVMSKGSADLLLRSRERDRSPAAALGTGGQDMLISRCREIMAAHTRKKKDEIAPAAAQDSGGASPDRGTVTARSFCVTVDQQAGQGQAFLSETPQASPQASFTGLPGAPRCMPAAGVMQSEWVRIPVVQEAQAPSMPGSDDYPSRVFDASWHTVEQQEGSAAACSTSAFGQPDTPGGKGGTRF